jgi:hypothetical protein
LVSEFHKSFAPDVGGAGFRRRYTYEHEASGEKKRHADIGRRRPKFHAINERPPGVENPELLICD